MRDTSSSSGNRSSRPLPACMDGLRLQHGQVDGKTSVSASSSLPLSYNKVVIEADPKPLKNIVLSRPLHEVGLSRPLETFTLRRCQRSLTPVASDAICKTSNEYRLSTKYSARAKSIPYQHMMMAHIYWLSPSCKSGRRVEREWKGFLTAFMTPQPNGSNSHSLQTMEGEGLKAHDTFLSIFFLSLGILDSNWKGGRGNNRLQLREKP